METKCLVIGIILLFVGVTIAPTINFNTVKASQQNIIKERINQRELLFQTIVDIANNKEIQRIILKYQMNRGIFPASEIPVVTKNQIRQMYFLGLILSKVMRTSKIYSMVQKFQLINPDIKQEINSIVEKNVTLQGEISQLSKVNIPFNLTIIQILISIVVIIVSLFLLIILILSGIPAFMTLAIWWIAKILEANHGVTILSDTITYIIELFGLISLTIFGICFFLLSAIWILPFITPYKCIGEHQ